MTIRDHPLAWRWTDPKYAEFPEEILAQISPLDVSAAATVHDRWFPYFDKFGEVITSRFARVEICRAEGTWNGDVFNRESPLLGRVTEWLRTREPDMALPITISWQRDC